MTCKKLTARYSHFCQAKWSWAMMAQVAQTSIRMGGISISSTRSISISSINNMKSKLDSPCLPNRLARGEAHIVLHHIQFEF
ncbi:hypothetical protein PAXRUDRAFT_729548 [Paxillus rubicundulus Ve08.2h10]|uniref:Uncharacterized protein n=1 Tax=Paxillus rubicundulus Ve08.2h10 TaxID=930991 RepID=A0A0D0EBR0_9AGAM|nr:hypothetical protein PAXRUDRAFT_729548 [Paxillus rubicundulus Ve08.2h10]